MDPLLPVVLVLIAWVLSERYYPDILYLETRLEYWLLGGLTSVFITLSIIIHELGHSLAARFFRIPIQRIHLYLFGGMAELQYRPQEARQEFFIAIAGPVASFLLALISWVIYDVILSPDYLGFFFFKFIALINFLIAVFNLLPIFPLDGGRLLRAGFWAYTKNYIRASRHTNRIGSFFIGILIILAIFDYFYFESGYSLIAGILAMYMFYTYHTGRGELKYNPEPDELIFPIPHGENTAEFIDNILIKRPELITECIIPVLDNGPVREVIDGSVIDSGYNAVDYEPGKRALEYGDFIDPDDFNSFSKMVTFRAEWVPVLKEGRFLGMCDAREMRFWLEQNYEYVLKH